MQYLFRSLGKANSFIFLFTFLNYVYLDPLCDSEADFARINQNSIVGLQFDSAAKKCKTHPYHISGLVNSTCYTE